MPLSQNSRILARLQRSKGKFVRMPELMLVSRCAVVHSRIADLRKRGHKIENHVIQDGRVKHSFYRLLA